MCSCIIVALLEITNNQLKGKPSSTLSTPDKSSFEFGFLLAKIVEELKRNEANNLDNIKTILSTLTVKGNSEELIFSDEQLEAFEACKNIRILLVRKLRHYYRWDDFSFLENILSNLESDKCSKWLEVYGEKLDSKMKLQDIYEYCMTEQHELPEGFDKMVAIVTNKNFFTITLEEYEQLKHFISQHCGVEPYVMLPSFKASTSSLLLEWYIPCSAVVLMKKNAIANLDILIAEGVIYLKLSATVIFDKRNNVRECECKFVNLSVCCILHFILYLILLLSTLA